MSVEAFANQLRRHRLAAGMTQESLAEAAGLSVRGISDLERGVKQRPHPETVRMLAAALSLSPEALESFKASATPRAGLAPPPFPESLTSLIGRDDDLGALSALLQPDSGYRLVTLTGPGGVGKTRLAQQVARDVREQFADGIAFVALAGLAEPRQVLPALAAAFGIRDLSDRAPLELLTRQLQERQVLAVVDNCEHLLASAPDLAALLASCRGLTVLATSRAPLRIAGEREYPVRPLPAPAPSRTVETGQVAASPSVQLFLRQAQAVRPDFAVTDANAAAVAEICARVDGLPLALELAAARMKTLAPSELAALLGNRLGVLTGGPRDHPARHQTVRATIEWSHALLPLDAQRAFRQLAVFPVGATLESAAAVLAAGNAVGALDRLTALIDQSLVQRQEGRDGQPHFVMLETVREYATEELVASEDDAPARIRHAAHFLAMAEQGEDELTGPDQAVWMRRLEADYGNLRSALAWAVEREDAESSQRFGSALWRFWAASGRLREAREWLDQALALKPGAVSAVRARALLRRGNIAVDLADYPIAREMYEASQAMFHLLDEPILATRALHGLGLVQYKQGAYDEARTVFASVLQVWQQTGSRLDEARAQLLTGHVAVALGNVGDARHAYADALAMFRELSDEASVSWMGFWLGRLERLDGNADDARYWLDRSLAGQLQVDDQLGIASVLHELGCLAHDVGDDDVALERHLASLREWEAAGTIQDIVDCLEGVAAVAIARGEVAHGVVLLAVSAAWRQRHGAPLPPPERSLLDRDLAAARAALSPDAFATGWEDGQRITVDAAISLARSGPSLGSTQ